MNHLKDKTSGIDCEIQEIQTDIYNELIKNFSNVAAHGRLYRNELQDGVYPQWFNAETQDYETVYMDDGKDVVLSFIDGLDHFSDDGITFTAPVKIVFWFNLKSLAGETFRRDDEVQRLASTILNRNVYNVFEFDKLQKGLRNVYSGFNINQIKRDDLHPYHVFSLNIKLTYKLTKNCS